MKLFLNNKKVQSIQAHPQIKPALSKAICLLTFSKKSKHFTKRKREDEMEEKIKNPKIGARIILPKL